MKLYKYFAALLLVVAMCSVVTATAKEKKVKRMYIFGVATSFNDSRIRGMQTVRVSRSIRRTATSWRRPCSS